MLQCALCAAMGFGLAITAGIVIVAAWIRAWM